jgi:hypothetical protein
MVPEAVGADRSPEKVAGFAAAPRNADAVRASFRLRAACSRISNGLERISGAPGRLDTR